MSLSHETMAHVDARRLVSRAASGYALEAVLGLSWTRGDAEGALRDLIERQLEAHPDEVIP